MVGEAGGPEITGDPPCYSKDSTPRNPGWEGHRQNFVDFLGSGISEKKPSNKCLPVTGKGGFDPTLFIFGIQHFQPKQVRKKKKQHLSING